MSESVRDVIQNWLKKNPLTFRGRWDGDVVTLIESVSAKKIALDTRRILHHRIQQNPQTLSDYVNLVFDNGVEVVLCHAGLAFSPRFTATGPLPDAPPVTCMADYQTLFLNLIELMSDPTRRPETLKLFNVLISILDGARSVGLDVGPEEEELNRQLTTHEKNISDAVLPTSQKTPETKS